MFLWTVTNKFNFGICIFLIQYGMVSTFLLRPLTMKNRQTRLVNQAHSSWNTFVSTNPNPDSAASELLNEIPRNSPPQIVFLFVGKAHGESFEKIVERVYTSLPLGTRLLSIVGGGVIGGSSEFDEPSKPSMAIMAGKLPKGAEIEVFSFNELKKPPPPPESEYWKNLGSSSYLLLADPWSPVTDMLKGLSVASSTIERDAVVVGGISMAVGARPTVAVDANALPQGSLVGIGFRGTLSLQAVVAQGCQPVSRIYTVTACEKNCIQELDFKPALKVMEECISSANENIVEQRKRSSGIVCGVASKGDYLIRSIVGCRKNGISIAGKPLQTGDMVRFFVRDKNAAKADLDLMLKRTEMERSLQPDNVPTPRPVAALQVSCVARGRRLFGVPNIDVSKIQELLKGPIGGFYANGQIGPVGIAGFSTNAKNTVESHVHGFTTIAALFCEHDYESSSSMIDSLSDKALDVWG